MRIEAGWCSVVAVVAVVAVVVAVEMARQFTLKGSLVAGLPETSSVVAGRSHRSGDCASTPTWRAGGRGLVVSNSVASAWEVSLVRGRVAGLAEGL